MRCYNRFTGGLLHEASGRKLLLGVWYSATGTHMEWLTPCFYMDGWLTPCCLHMGSKP